MLIFLRRIPDLEATASSSLLEAKHELTPLVEEPSDKPAVELRALISKLLSHLDLHSQGVSGAESIIQQVRLIYQNHRISIRGTVPLYLPFSKRDQRRKECEFPKFGRLFLPAKEGRTGTVVEIGKDGEVIDDDRKAVLIGNRSEGDNRVTKRFRVVGSMKECNALKRDEQQKANLIDLDYVHELVERHSGREGDLPGNIPFAAKEALARISTCSWSEITAKTLEEVRPVVIPTANKLMDKYFQAPRVRQVIRSAVHNHINSLFPNGQKNLDWLVGFEDRPYMKNLHYLEGAQNSLHKHFSDARGS